MQKIKIDKIIDKLKKGKHWNYYEKTIKDNVGKKYLEYCIGKKGILEINKIDKKTKELLKTENWSRFKQLKKEFINLIFKEINYCPNCGKVPFLNIDNGEKNLKGFDLDHFFPKSKFPYLTFNFYNLIPICPFCNQKIKKDRNPLNFDGNIFNPYFGILEIKSKKVKFTDSFNIDKCFKFSKILGVKGSYFDKGYSNFLNLKDIYLGTSDTNNVFNFIQDKEYKIKDEQTRLPNKVKTKKDWITYFFKDYYPKSENEILQFSNGKLKKDLIENLEIN